MTFIKNIKKQIWRFQRIARSRLGIGSNLNSPDRLFQENMLIPNALKSGDILNVLYVGVSWYTYRYYKTLFRKTNLTTIDILREQAVYGSKRHITGGLDSPGLASYAPFDVIFLLGILNYGINDPEALRRAMTHIDHLLAENGCCYLTVEEATRNAATPTTINSSDAVRIVESTKYRITPISNWIEMTSGYARTRFFVMGRTSERPQTELAKIPE